MSIFPKKPLSLGFLIGYSSHSKSISSVLELIEEQEKDIEILHRGKNEKSTMTVEIFGSISNKKKNFADVSFSSLEKER